MDRSHAIMPAMVLDSPGSLTAPDEALVLPGCTLDVPHSSQTDNGLGSQWFEPQGNAITIQSLPGYPAVTVTADQPVHEVVASDYPCSMLLAGSAILPADPKAAGAADGGSATGASGAAAFSPAAAALESGLPEQLDPKLAENLPSFPSHHPVYPSGYLSPASPPACLHQQAEPQMNMATGISPAKSIPVTEQLGFTSMQANAATSDHPAVVPQGATVRVPLPGCELFTSADFLAHHHDDASLSINVGNESCGIDMGLPCNTRNGLKFEGPVAVTPHMITARTGEGGIHGASSSGDGGIQSYRGGQPQWISRQRASVDLLRAVDDMLTVATGTKHTCATEWEPAENGAQLHDSPGELHESALAIDGLEGGDRVLPAVTTSSSCLLSGLAISTDVPLAGGLDEAEVERLAAVLLADIETSTPEMHRSLGDERPASCRWLQPTAAGGLEGTAHRPTTAAQENVDKEKMIAEADELADMEKDGSGVALTTGSGCMVLPPPWHKTGSGIEGEATPHRGTTSGRSTWRLQRNRNYHMPGRYRGVRCRGEGRYSAELKVGNVRRWLGTFPTAEEAARAFDKAAMEVSGRNARLNFPLQDRTGRDQAKKRKRREEWPSGGGGSPRKNCLGDKD